MVIARHLTFVPVFVMALALKRRAIFETVDWCFLARVLRSDVPITQWSGLSQ